LRNAWVSALATTSLNHLFRRATIGAGVALGTMAANQPTRSIGTPDSVIVGSSGFDFSRSADATASTRSLPSRTWLNANTGSCSA
jgi:hypothetical protein